ncbi:hypothetical protein CANARDRAFT_6470 [[Candida] arabinofermentans NRRL YB-2248]|uniref:Transcriptional coactivator HFI1/ADA1 n=1 Tax=[Candida] arabinofermentans NRRL YB-2248 TaxID=983967 RepID=A0A1E4T560_9ASCO|nr:hypothetical protein CANARDRAFT_6470 [[Candida] arabinofermentans NRRL YB-2248]
MAFATVSPVSVATTPRQSNAVSTPASTNATNGFLIPKGKNGSTKRIEIENLVVEFQKKLGKSWDEYQVSVSLFLVGKLSRSELMDKLSHILDKSTLRMHNQLLLANLANSLRDEPLDGMSSTGFGNQHILQSKKRKTSNKSSQYELLKTDILSLSIRERKRLKNIKRESGKKGMVNSTIAMTRQAIVPKVPIVTNSENGSAGQTSQWGQDILDGLQTLLCTESYELPERSNLKTRITGIAREHGLINDVNEKVPEVMTLALEYHLKGIIENAMDLSRFKGGRPTTLNDSKKESRKRKNITLTIEDLYDTLESAPHLVEPCGPSIGLPIIKLRNDDDPQLLQQQKQYFKGTPGSGSSGSHTKHSNISFLLSQKANPAELKAKAKAKVAESVTQQATKPPTSAATAATESHTANPATTNETAKKEGATPVPTSTGNTSDQNGDAAKQTTNNTSTGTPNSVGSNGNGKSSNGYVPPPNLSLNDPNIGAPEELNWLINDLLGN